MKGLRTIKMGFRIADIVVAVLFNFVCCVYAAGHILPCDDKLFEPCPGDNQFCNQTSHECECEPGFWLEDKECKIEGSSPHHATTAVVVIFTLALVTVGLVLVVRKYNLIDYARQKITRRNNDVMYEDVMIGHDDPPLSP